MTIISPPTVASSANGLALPEGFQEMLLRNPTRRQLSRAADEVLLLNGGWKDSLETPNGEEEREFFTVRQNMRTARPRETVCRGLHCEELEACDCPQEFKENLALEEELDQGVDIEFLLEKQRADQQDSMTLRR